MMTTLAHQKNRKKRCSRIKIMYTVMAIVFGLQFALFCSMIWRSGNDNRYEIVAASIQIQADKAQFQQVKSPPATTKTKKIVADTSLELAARESLGFFTDIPETAWRRMKERFQLTKPNYDRNAKRRRRHIGYPNYFFSQNFEPEFTCAHEVRLGFGDGGKWVCDPFRIAAEATQRESKRCLVYSVGCNGKTQFESALLTRVSNNCDVHVFDLLGYGRHKNFTVAVEKIGGTFHHWGIGYGKNYTFGGTDPSLKKQFIYKTWKETIQDLGHTNTYIDVLKIDCEGCEYKDYLNWIEDWKATGVTIRQLLIELHGGQMTFPHDTEFFMALQKLGYVLFHKEANFISKGYCIEVAFLLLSKDFQRNDL